jgi:opacity protein-like surface antigen
VEAQVTRSACKAVFVAALASAGALASQAQAQALDDRYWFEAQAYWPQVDTKVRVAGTGGLVGSEIDLEGDLDLTDRKGLAAFMAGARIGERWSIVGEYYGLDRSASAEIGRDITFDDVVYPAGANIASSFDTKVYRAVVGYAFLQRDNVELGASLGLHVTQFKVTLQGAGRLGDASVESDVRKRDALAPLPTLGLYGAYAFTPRLTATARVDYLSLKVGDYDGRLTNSEARLSYRVFDHVGVGAGYRYVDYHLDIDHKRWSGELAYKFKGPVLFVQAAF